MSAFEWGLDLMPTPNLFEIDALLASRPRCVVEMDDMDTDDDFQTSAEFADCVRPGDSTPPQVHIDSTTPPLILQSELSPDRDQNGQVSVNCPPPRPRSAGLQQQSGRNMRGVSCDQCRLSRRKCRPGSQFGCSNCESKRQFCSHWTRATLTPLLVNNAASTVAPDEPACPMVAPIELVSAMRAAVISVAQHPSLQVRSQAPPLRLWPGEPALLVVPDFDRNCWFIGDVNVSLCEMLGLVRDDLVFQEQAIHQHFQFFDDPLPLTRANMELPNPGGLPWMAVRKGPGQRLVPMLRHADGSVEPVCMSLFVNLEPARSGRPGRGTVTMFQCTFSPAP